ncbi:MAG: hypothetical protein RSF67_02390, partial [Clostridia bacterium]
MKNIYKISLILIMFICSFSSLYAFSLNIKAEYVKDSISNGCIAVFRLTQKAHQSSIDMYNNNTKYHDSDGWINKNSSTTQFFGLLGGNGNYTNHEMLIYKMDAANNPLTNFNYQARVNEYNVPVIYATSAKEMNIHRIPQISDFGYGLAYLNIHQGTSLPSNSVNVSFSEGWENRFKIVNGCIWVEDYRIPAKTIEKLKNNNIIKNEKSTARVSFATNTKNKRVIPNRNATSMYSSGADSAWKFYNTAFSYKVFGFNMGGMYNPDNVDLSKPFPEGATANVFDNVITFDPIPNQKRQVWISHNDENGNQLNGLKNDSMKIKNSNNVESIIPNIALPAEYEKYNFDSLNNAYPKSSGKTTYNGKPIIMTSYQIKIGKTYDEANPINTPKIEAGELPVLKSKNESDFVRIRVYYETAGTGAEVPVQPLEPAKLVGRLCFVNTGSFNNSTRSDLLDYIPSTETLTPYIKGAYPYIVRALNYEKITKDYVSTQSSITVSQSWHGNWSYRCGGCGAHGQTCTTDKNGKKTCRNLSGRHSGSNSGTEYYTYKYYVPYQHIYYEITNFKMFRIADVEVYDDDNNKGGILFEGTKYNLIMSNEYEKRFSGSQGIIRAKITIDEPKKSYSLNSISSSCSNCSSNNMSGTANSNIRNVGANRAISGLKSNGEDFKIKFTYFNDYVNLDETTDMIKKNENTVYYDITNENSPKQILNSANISGNSYTSELENYMKPINKLTNLEDFKQIPKNVPKDRVNGMRDLKGKITYKLVNDSKYNIGSNNFTAKNSTY